MLVIIINQKHFYVDENGIVEDENMIQFNYSNIVSENLSELGLINDIIHMRKENRQLLKHPLLEALIMMKWRKFQWLWFMMLVLQLIFTILIFRIGTLLLKFEPNNCKDMIEADNLTKGRFHMILIYRSRFSTKIKMCKSSFYFIN